MAPESPESGTAYRFRANDLVLAALSTVFAVFSLAWPRTGALAFGAGTVPRGYAMALAYLGMACIALLAPFIEVLAWSRAVPPRFRRLLIFIRTYYSQAFIGLFFTDSILLSSQALGGHPHDAFFQGLDKAMFGFQPARQFSRLLGSQPWINELMFGVYFAYFPFMVVAIWLPFFKGRRAEGERQLFTVCAMAAVVFTWYVFFRVEGPKYWLPDLRREWYDAIQGGFFVQLFKESLARTTLSGAAFPSTHVLLTLTTLRFALKNDRRYFAVYLPIAALILCSTVYIHAHWAADILGGAITAVLLGPLFYRLHGRAEAFAFRVGPRRVRRDDSQPDFEGA